MIDETTARIFEARVDNRRRQARRMAYDKLIALTDTVLWQLEEMNRDGISELSLRHRQVIYDRFAGLPGWLRQMYCGEGSVQEALDSLFEMQQALFKARHPEYEFGESDEIEAD
jgi:AAA+ ATPase superfamily predicted ATPase